MTDEQKKSIQDNVLAAIEAGRVHMRPRWQFVLKAILLAVGLVLAALAVLFVGSFIVFMLQQNGAWFAPAFGGPGIKELFVALPLAFILVTIIFIILLQILIRRYAISYGKPALYSVIGIAAFVVVGSFLVAQSHFHEGLFIQARDRNLPIAGGFYREFGAPHADRIVAGTIVEKIDNGFIIEDPRDQQFTIVITSETQFPNDTEFDLGDDVVVLGDQNGAVIEADGVRTFEGREEIFRHHLVPPPQ